MAGPIDVEAQAWLDETRKLLKTSKAKKGPLKALAKDLTQDIKSLDGVMTKLLVASAVRHARFIQRRHDVANAAVLAARQTDEVALKAADAAIKKLSDDLHAEIKAHKSFLERSVKLDEDRAKLEIEVEKTAGLRGARTTGTPVNMHLAAASALMQSAADYRNKAVNEVSDSALEDAIAALALVKTKLGEAAKDAKAAEQSTKAYLDAMKQWGLLEPKAREVLQKMRDLPGAEAMASDLQTALGEARGGIKNADGVFTGHDDAVVKIGDLDALLLKARQTSTAHLAMTLPGGVIAAKKKIDPDLDAYEKLVPPYLDKAVRSEAAAALEVGRRDINAAIKGLTDLQARLKKEASDLQRDKTASEAADTQFKAKLAALARLQVPEALYAGLQQAGMAASLLDMADRQWSAATIRLTQATVGLSAIEARYAKFGPEWKRCRLELEGIRREAGALVSFPVVRGAANALRQEADDLLGQFVGGELEAAINAHKAATVGKPPLTLLKALEELNKLAKSKGVPVGDGKGTPPDETQRKAFLKVLNDSIKLVRWKEEATRATLQGQIDGNKQLTPTRRRLLEAHWNSQVDAIERDWLNFHQSSGGDTKALEKQAKASADALEKLVKEQGKLKGKELDTTLHKLETDDKRTFEANTPKWIEQAIGWLAEMGVDVSKERKALTDAGKLPKDKVTTAMLTLADAVRKKLDAQKQARAEAREDSRNKLSEEVDGPLKKLPVSKVFREELQKESLDTRAMIDTDDPDLLAAANARLDRHARLITDIAAHPEKHEANKSALEAFGPRLQKMADVLPDSFRMLQTKLTKLFVDAKHTDPIAMETLIAAFDLDVVEKEKDLAARKQAIKDQYAPLKKAIEAAWDKQTGLLGNTLTVGGAFFPKEFVLYKEARLADASSLVKTELPIAQVLAPLQALKAKLDTVTSAPNENARKAAVQKLNAEEVDNQRQVRDMAAQFEREMKAFKDGLLVQAVAAAKADPDGDTHFAKSLEGVASAAGKMVAPYLKLLGTLPHETYGSQAAPDMQRMKQDFERARAMLGEAERSARRLIDTPSTTNVSGPSKDGLRKLLPKWRERCGAYDAALRAMAEAMRSAAAGEADAVKTAAEKAAKLVESAAGSFRADAFAASFAGLLEPLPDKKDKAGREKVEKLHLARREDALRVMRQYRTELTENKLRRLLTDAAQNPFEAATLMAAAGALRVTLKEIELQALDSV